MKSQTIVKSTGVSEQATAAHAAPNIDGFFRSRSATLQLNTPPVRDTVAVQTLSDMVSTPRAKRGINHANAHKPQAAKTSVVRVQSSKQSEQQLTVRRGAAAPNHAKAHPTQHSQTLMRTAVKKPAPSFRRQAGTQGSLQHAVPSLIVPKKSVVSLDADRLARAHTTSKSPYVAHHSTPKPVIPTVAPIPVAPQPVRPAEEVPANSPAPQAHQAADIFEHAIANASHYVDLHAHHRAYRKKVKTHVASMLAGSTLLIAIAGFMAYQNSPGMQFRTAALKAGVSAHLPNFAALGYTYNGAKAQDSKLMIGLKNDRSVFTVTQQATNLSSSDMIQNISATDASGTPDYTIVPAGSTSVYRFANNSATWIQDGKWYTVTGNTALSDSQLQNIVKNI